MVLGVGLVSVVVYLGVGVVVFVVVEFGVGVFVLVDVGIVVTVVVVESGVVVEHSGLQHSQHSTLIS